ncbi:MAG: hypothetical protein IH830_13905 [Planctomycetes bacterium]|nr:hypothetical protein [Planctomycetota bacterium]
MRLRKAFLWSMIVSLALAALLGISALILPRWYRYDEEILLSTVLFGAYSLVALICASVLEKRRFVALMWTGLAAAGAALAGWLLLTWFHAAFHSRAEMRVARIAGTFTIITVLLGQSGLLTLPRFDHPWAGGVRWMTIGVSSLLAATGIALVWFGWIAQHIDEWRVLGVLGILAACGTVVTPILWKVQAARRAESADTIPRRLQLQVTCPRCQSQQQLRTGPAKCAQCGLRITIAVEEPRCACGYLLYRLESNRCPECGREIAEADRWAAT